MWPELAHTCTRTINLAHEYLYVRVDWRQHEGRESVCERDKFIIVIFFLIFVHVHACRCAGRTMTWMET